MVKITKKPEIGDRLYDHRSGDVVEVKVTGHSIDKAKVQVRTLIDDMEMPARYVYWKRLMR